ncbi:hypothetical protein SRIMM317S_02659 [Streptomyces rimosus subsp. rimosus]
MKGSKGRSPWLWVRSWTMSHRTNASWQRCWSASIARMSSGSSTPSVATAASLTRRKRAASRSQKMPPQVKRSGASRTAMVSGKRTAELVSYPEVKSSKVMPQNIGLS